MKQSVYLETTIPSYMAARISKDIRLAGKQATTQDFFEQERSRYDFYISRYVLEECAKGDPDVAKRRLDLLRGIEVLPDTPEIEPLADVYMRILFIPPDKRIDALHLAMCCVHEITILVSWNCTHLGTASMQIVQRYNDAHGLHTPQMTTPNDLMEDDFNG